MIIRRFGGLSRRRLLALSVDAALIVLAYYLALGFRFAGSIPEDYWAGRTDYWVFLGLVVVAHLLANWFANVYRIINRYIGLIQAIHVMEAAVTAMGFLLLVDLLWPSVNNPMPFSVVVAGSLFAGLAMVGVRFYGRIFHERSLTNVRSGRRVLLVGAGQAAEMLVREIDRNASAGIRLVGLVDDDPDLRGMRLHRYPVLGSVRDIPDIVADLSVSEIIIAIPSARPEELARIHETARPARVPVKTLPGLGELVDGRVTLEDARALDIEDLLGRPKVETDLAAIAEYLAGRRVLVTGAGGSIGSELSRQIARFRPADLVLLDRDESALYHLHEDLKAQGAEGYQLIPGSIMNPLRMERIFAQHRPQVVFHAAAFKHVPLMELHPAEAVLNNVRGTQIVAETAARHGAERFVNISTDKAVDPVNVMGATKRCGEQYVRWLSTRHPATHFCSVRFGNVLGSRGSVIPIFRRQIAAGGPVTVTHPEMTRYFMMIEEAVQLVLQAAAMLEEIPPDRDGSAYGAFVLEMGRPVRILDLARQMIAFLGDGTGEDIAIEYTGLRPGEKLHETLVCAGELPEPTGHELISLARLRREADNPSALPPDFAERLEELIALATDHADREPIIAALRACVPTYAPFDWSQVGRFPGVSSAEQVFPAPDPIPSAERLEDSLLSAESTQRGDRRTGSDPSSASSIQPIPFE